MDTSEVVIFVEDPGAANYMAPVCEVLRRRGIVHAMFAEGPAASYLRGRAVELRAVPSTWDAKQLIEQTGCRLVLVGTSENLDSFGLALVTAARGAGCETVGVVDGPANAAHRFRGRGDQPLAFAPDWLLVPDEWTGTAYRNVGFPASRVLVCGHPHYDYVVAQREVMSAVDRRGLRRKLFSGASDDRVVVVFASETSTGLNAEQYR